MNYIVSEVLKGCAWACRNGKTSVKKSAETPYQEIEC